MANNLTGYELSRNWFDFCFENPEKVNVNHTAIFFFAIEHCNRLGWKEKFGFPTQMAMDAIGIRKHETYIKYFLHICEWGFFNLIQRSVNQYSANIISLSLPTPKNGKALGKAIRTHAGKQIDPIGESMGESNSSIDKPYNLKPNNHITNENIFPAMPLPENCGECPEQTIKDCVVIYQTVKYQKIEEWQVQDLWPVFLRQHVTGNKYYASVEAVYSHFVNWIKTQDFKQGTEIKKRTSSIPEDQNEW